MPRAAMMKYLSGPIGQSGQAFPIWCPIEAPLGRLIFSAMQRFVFQGPEDWIGSAGCGDVRQKVHQDCRSNR